MDVKVCLDERSIGAFGDDELCAIGCKVQIRSDCGVPVYQRGVARCKVGAESLRQTDVDGAVALLDGIAGVCGSERKGGCGQSSDEKAGKHDQRQFLVSDLGELCRKRMNGCH